MYLNITIVLCTKNFGKTPLYVKKIIKKNEMEKLAEVERIRAIKPPLRYLSLDERNELLTVSGVLCSIIILNFLSSPCQHFADRFFVFNRE